MPKNFNRRNFYMNDSQLGKYQEIEEYFGNLSPVESVHGDSAIINRLVSTFYDLIVEGNKGESFAARIAELKSGSTKSKTVVSDSKNYSADLKALKRQSDIQNYAVLAVYLMLRENKDLRRWQPGDQLKSIYANASVPQDALMDQIAKLIKFDVARGQTIKSSHQGTNRVK